MAQTSEHGCMQEAVRMVQFPPDLLNDPNFTQPRFRVKIIYAKKSVNFIKIKFATNCNYFKIIQWHWHFSKILLKQKKILFLSFPWSFTQTESGNATIIRICRVFEATNLRQRRKFYTTAGCDGWDLYRSGSLGNCHLKLLVA